jgi:archaellum component FlaC
MKTRYYIFTIICLITIGCYKTDPEVLNLLKAISVQNEGLKSQVAILQKSTDSLSAALKNTNNTVNSIDKKIDSLKTQINLITQQINLLNTELSKANANITDLQAKLNELNKKCEELFSLLNQIILNVNLNNLTFVNVQTSDSYSLINTNTAGKYFLITKSTVLKSEDFGNNWSSTNWPLGIIRNGVSTNTGGAWSNFNNGQFISASLDNGYYITQNSGTSYTQSGPTGFGCASSSIMTLSDGRFIASMSGFQRGIYKSSGTNNQTWTQVWTHFGDVTDFTNYKNNTIYACHAKAGCCNPDGGIIKSTDEGSTWTRLSSIPNNGIQDIEVVEDSLAWIDEKGNFYLSNATNPNVNVNPIYKFGANNTVAGSKGVYEFDMRYNTTKKVIAATSTSGLYISTDLGKSWKNYTFTGATMYYNVTFVDNYLFICSDVGVYRAKL